MSIFWVVAAILVAVAAVLAAVILGLRGGDDNDAPQVSEQTQARREPVFGTTQTAAESQPQTAQGQLDIESFNPPTLPPPPEDMLAADMCYAVYVFAQAPMHPDAFVPLLEQWRKWRLPRHILLGYGEDDKQWRAPHGGGNENKKNWLLAVPLADRGGALDETRIRQLEESARQFCQSIEAHGKFPSADDSAKNAKLLDAFCNSADKIVEMHLAGNPSLARTAEAAKVCGLVAADGGRGLKYAFRQNSETLFSMTVLTRARGEVRRVVFDLDAPNVSNPTQAFDAMANAIARTASMLSLNITDRNGEAVSGERICDMHKQIAVLSTEMQKFGVSPGGAIARLLFS